MEQILNIISNEWVIMTMIVLVFVLIGWLTFVRVRAHSSRKKPSEFKER